MMSLDFFPCKITILYDALYVYDACNVLVKSYSKSVKAKMHGIVLVELTTDPGVMVMTLNPEQDFSKYFVLDHQVFARVHVL